MLKAYSLELLYWRFTPAVRLPRQPNRPSLQFAKQDEGITVAYAVQILDGQRAGFGGKEKVLLALNHVVILQGGSLWYVSLNELLSQNYEYNFI